MPYETGSSEGGGETKKILLMTHMMNHTPGNYKLSQKNAAPTKNTYYSSEASF